MPSPSGPSMTAIVAATSKNGIGLNGTLPWRLPGEMKYFAKVTSTTPAGSSNPNAVIMGRNTWESVPPRFRPLKDRLNFVISQKGIDVSGSPDTSSYPSLSAALLATPPHTRLFLIGGAQLYTLGLDPSSSSAPIVDRILLTRILSASGSSGDTFQCDTFLHDFQNDQRGDGQPLWVKRSHAELQAWVGFEVQEENEEKGVGYRYEMWTLAE